MTKRKTKDLLPFSPNDLESMIGKELYVCAFQKSLIERTNAKVSCAVKKYNVDVENLEPIYVGIVGELIVGPPDMLTFYHLGDARAIGHKKGNRIEYAPPADLEHYIMTLKISVATCAGV